MFPVRAVWCGDRYMYRKEGSSSCRLQFCACKRQSKTENCCYNVMKKTSTLIVICRLMKRKWSDHLSCNGVAVGGVATSLRAHFWGQLVAWVCQLFTGIKWPIRGFFFILFFLIVTFKLPIVVVPMDELHCFKIFLHYNNDGKKIIHIKNIKIH